MLTGIGDGGGYFEQLTNSADTSLTRHFEYEKGLWIESTLGDKAKVDLSGDPALPKMIRGLGLVLPPVML